MKIIIKILITAVAAFGISKILGQNVQITHFSSALIFAIVLGLLNVSIRPIISLFSLPITLITLGFFSLVINALIILLADSLTEGITINGFWWAFVFSILLSFFTSLLERIFINKD